MNATVINHINDPIEGRGARAAHRSATRFSLQATEEDRWETLFLL